MGADYNHVPSFLSNTHITIIALQPVVPIINVHMLINSKHTNAAVRHHLLVMST